MKRRRLLYSGYRLVGLLMIVVFAAAHATAPAVTAMPTAMVSTSSSAHHVMVSLHGSAAV